MKRLVSLLLVFMLLIGGGIFALLTGASEVAPTLRIAYCNLSFRESVCIKYAVEADVSDVKVLIWTAPEADYIVGTQDDEITAYYTEEIGGVSHKIFDYTKLAAKQMTDVIYARAYAKVNGADVYGEVNKYSILQYAYNKLGKTATASTDAVLKEMLTHMLAYGAAAQKYFDNYKADRLATADWYQVKLTAGVLDDGCMHGLYLAGDKVTMTAPATDAEGATFTYWADSKNNKVATTATYELTVGNKNEVYTPVYVKYSSGLEFDSNGDGTCYIVGMGDCADTDLVIPAVSPEGDTVIGIDSSAFAGEAIVSVSFPHTLEEIGRRAFNNCTELTDVYYDGTEEEWNNNVSISAGNDAIENATKHFNEPIVEIFTVTFIDYDGTVLKTEIVEEGSGATPPANPTRDGYTFVGWDKTFEHVTSNLIVMAEYEYNVTEPTVVIGNATASIGEEVEIVFDLVNSPELYAMSLQIVFDDIALELVSATSGEAMSLFTYTEPSQLKKGANFMWYANDPAIANGTVLKMVFKIKDTATAGNYSVTMTCDPDNTYDANDNDVVLNFVDGSIVVTE